MVVSKTLKTSIATIIKDSEMLKLVPDHLTTRKICKHATKKSPFVKKNVPQRLCDKVILENGGTIMFIPDCYNNQSMCDNVVDNYAHVPGYVSDCYEIPKTCNKADSSYPSAMQFVPDQFDIKKHVIKLLILVHLYLILFLIDI